MASLNELREAAETVSSLGDRLTERLAAVERRQSRRQYRAQSDGGVVTATVDWRSDLVEVDINAALTRTRGVELANQVTQAVNRARAEASGALAEAMRATA